jgi:hypothetical protein
VVLKSDRQGSGFSLKPNLYLGNKWSESREWLGDEGMGSIKFNPSEKYHFAFWFQKTRVRLYVNENKELDLPRGLNSGHIYIIRIFYFKGIKTIVNQYD